MGIAACYTSLHCLLDYPWHQESLLTGHDIVSDHLKKHRLECSLAPFAEFVATATPAELEEEYVATFDFNPAVAPYLGHHLFGDNQKKGAYLIRLKQEYGRYGYTPAGKELPDHLPAILGFLAHLSGQECCGARSAFIAAAVLPGVEKLAACFATSRPDSPWRPVVEATRIICSADSAAVAASLHPPPGPPPVEEVKKGI